MSVGQSVGSDEQLARLLQIGVVLEELVEARAYEHYRSLAEEAEEAGESKGTDGAQGADGVDDEIEELLLEAREESGEHRERLEALITELEAESIPYSEIEALVREKYGHSKPEDIEAVLHDQLTSEETAYNYYDRVIAAVEAGDVEYGIERDRLLETLRDIRAEEAEGAEEVSEVIERQ